MKPGLSLITSGVCLLTGLLISAGAQAQEATQPMTPTPPAPVAQPLPPEPAAPPPTAAGIIPAPPPGAAQAGAAGPAAGAEVGDTGRAAGAIGPREWEFGVSIFGLANGSFLTELSDADKGGYIYPGFGGVGGGGGLDLHGAWRGIIGLDLGFFISRDTGDGSVNDLDFTVGQTALHIPIRVRVQLPSESVVRPYLFGGPSIVVPLGDAEVSNVDPTLQAAIDVGNAPRLGAKVETYLAWSVGLGFDFLLPIDGEDFRIPLTIRAHLNPGVGDKITDRLEAPITQDNYVFRTEWEIQAVATLGFAWYFR